jgi:hypothetical protein
MYDGQLVTIVAESGAKSAGKTDHPIWVIEGDGLTQHAGACYDAQRCSKDHQWQAGSGLLQDDAFRQGFL